MTAGFFARLTTILSIHIAALLLATNAYAQSFPDLTGRVVDQADLLSDAEESALTAKLEALEINSNRQLVVTTISDLEGYDIADYGYRLGREWAIGQDGKGEAEKDNGILLIIAPNERKMRIEVGYGLEGTMTDALASQIIRNDITPQFKAGNFPGGINAGVDRIITQLTLPPDQALQVVQQVDEVRNNKEPNIGLVIFWLFVFFFIFVPMLSALFGGKRHRRDGYSGPVVIWGNSGSSWGSGGSSWGSSGGSSWGGGFSGGGGSFGGGGASGGW